jgi:hypothetical protein
MVCMVPKVGKLVDFLEESWLCCGGGGRLFGSVFG